MRQRGGRDLAGAAGRGGEAVVAGQRPRARGEVGRRQGRGDRGRRRHVLGVVGPGRLRHGETVGTDEPRQAEIGRGQPGVGRAVVGLGRIADDCGGEGGRRDRQLARSLGGEENAIDRVGVGDGVGRRAARSALLPREVNWAENDPSAASGASCVTPLTVTATSSPAGGDWVPAARVPVNVTVLPYAAIWSVRPEKMGVTWLVSWNEAVKATPVRRRSRCMCRRSHWRWP